MLPNLSHIHFPESLILGWKQEQNHLSLFLELHLTQKHPNFEVFDPKTTFGCFKLAVFHFADVDHLHGLPTKPSAEGTNITTAGRTPPPKKHPPSGANIAGKARPTPSPPANQHRCLKAAQHAGFQPALPFFY